MPAAPRARLSGGVHFLASPRIARKLVQSCQLTAADLVIEFGAGQGAVTTQLAETNARILAVERDAEFVRKLRSRFDDYGNVRVVHADARHVPLPHKRFSVVASIPYALSTLLLRRLLTPHSSALDRAALIVEWGFAQRVTAKIPRGIEQYWWAARYELRVVSRVPANCFAPRPRVDSAHILVTKRKPTNVRALWTLLSEAHRRPAGTARTVCRDRGILRRAGIDPGLPAGRVRPEQWAKVARIVDRRLPWPPLPRRIR